MSYGSFVNQGLLFMLGYIMFFDMWLGSSLAVVGTL